MRRSFLPSFNNLCHLEKLLNAPNRISRFNVTSSPPPHLNAVLRGLEKACRSRPINKNTVRGTCASADSWYKDKGKSDDCLRFLLNVGILLEEDRMYYYDEDRAKVVLASIQDGRQPAPAVAAGTRISAIKTALTKARPSASCITAPPTDEAGQAPPISPSAVQTPDTHPTPVAPYTPLVPPALFRALPMPEGFITDPEFVLYLTPVERDVWESAIIQARQIADSKRIGVPADPDRLRETWGDARIEATAEDYQKAFRRFVDVGLIREIGPSGNEHLTHEFVRNPDLYIVVPIPGRAQYELSPVYLDIIRTIQGGGYILPSTRGIQHHFAEWIASKWPEVNPDTVRNKMVYFAPDNEYSGYGILYRHSGRYLLSVKGFERFDFVSNQQPVIRKIRAEHPPVAPSSSPEASASIPQNENDLETQIQELEEEIGRQQSQLVVLKLALEQRRSARREELKRQITEAARIREEADKQEARARAELRKLGVELPK